MANSVGEELSHLAPATLPITGSELVYLVQGGSSKCTTAAALADVLPDATPSTPGKLSVADKTRLDQLAATGSPSFAGLTITGPNAVVIPHIHGSLYGSIYFHVKNTSGVALTKGTPVTAGDSVGDTDVLQVVATDSATPGAEYANGVLRDDLAVDGEGYAIIVGELQDVNTAAYARGPLWVAGGGGMTSTRPASGAQQVATLGRHHAVNGSLLVAIQGVEPTAAQIGADPAGTASAAISSHLAAADPHAQYTTMAEAVAAAPVQSVAGWTGAVVLSPSDVGAQPADADLAAIAALTTHPFGRSLLTVADDAATRALIGAGTSNLAVGSSNPAALGAAAAPGSSGDAARSDHVHALPGVVSTTTAGLAPAIGTPSGRYLRDDATWATVPSGGGGSPAGTATEIQYRSSGTALGAIPNSAVDGTSGRVQLAGIGAGVAPRAGFAVVLGSNVLPRAQVVTISGSTYTCDIRAANRFMLAGDIAGNTTIAFSNVADLVATKTTAEYVEVEVDFHYIVGVITISAAGFTTKWDGNVAATPTAGEFEKLIVQITPAVAGTPFTTPTAYVAPMRGNT